MAEEEEMTNIQVIEMVREMLEEHGFFIYYYQPHNSEECSDWRRPRTTLDISESFWKEFHLSLEDYSSFKFPIVPVVVGEVKPCCYSDLQKITNFKPESIIRKTQLGRLFRGSITDGSEERSVIIRTWDLLYPLGKHHAYLPNQFCSEIELLTNEEANKHQNLAKLRSYCYETRLAAVYDENPDNFMFLKDVLLCDDFGWGERINVATQLADLLVWLHEKNIAVGSVTASCIMLDQGVNIKVFDFGYVSNRINKDSKITVEYGYAVGRDAPEAYGGMRTVKSDVFIFGLLLMELISKTELDFNGLLFDVYTKGKPNAKCLVHDCFKEVDSKTACSISDLTISCLNFDPSQRPTMKEVFDELKATRTGKNGGGKRKREEDEAN